MLPRNVTRKMGVSNIDSIPTPPSPQPSYCTDETSLRFIIIVIIITAPSQWPSGLRRGSAADRLLALRVRIPPRAWTFVCCKCRVLLGRCLCDRPIPRPEESYRLWCVVVCDQMNNNPLHLTWLGRKMLD